VVRTYQPWPAPVQAACYSDPSVLPEIDNWVTMLRAQGRVGPEVSFMITRRHGVPVGVLRDRAGDYELAPAAFLVFGRSGLHILDDRSFFRRYHQPGGYRSRPE
jgi:hypothetical protein